MQSIGQQLGLGTAGIKVFGASLIAFSDQFMFDVFLSYSSHDKRVVHALAERLRLDGVRVWLDNWEIHAGDSIPAKVETGLEQSRVLVLCMSASAFGSEWSQLEAGTFRFRDPLNRDRRFVPVRLDDMPIKGSIAQFSYISWRPKDRKREYPKLLDACLAPSRMRLKSVRRERGLARQILGASAIQLECKGATLNGYSFSPDRKRVATWSTTGLFQIWDLENGRHLKTLVDASKQTMCAAWSQDQRHLLAGTRDNLVQLLDVKTGRSLRNFKGHAGPIRCIAWGPDSNRFLSGGADCTIRLWNVGSETCIRATEDHQGKVSTIAWHEDQKHAVSGDEDGIVRYWDLEVGRYTRIFEGHGGAIRDVAWCAGYKRVLSGGDDDTIRLWDIETGRCLRILEGHTNSITAIAVNPDGRSVLSSSLDNSARIWDVETGRCVRSLEGHAAPVSAVWGPEEFRAISADTTGAICVWALSGSVQDIRSSKPSTTVLPSLPLQVQYTNAKVLLVGETGAGKTGLSKALAGEKWQPSDSTVGAWATQWKLPVSSTDTIEREIWLWDFGGQADQRLIHQLYMDETALAVLVFDGQKEDLFETLGQWDRDLTRASRRQFSKLLAAGRVDAGGLRVGRRQIETFASERGFGQLFETSAKFGTGCEELRAAILHGIDWDNIPWRSSPALFKRLKDEIIRLKDAGHVIMRFNELRETLRMRLSGEEARFTDDKLSAVLRLLAGPGVVWELRFGSWILLQPERINAYAQAVLQTMRQDEFERGCVAEHKVLNGNLVYHSSMARLQGDEERFILLAMHQSLVERGVCLREHTEEGTLLVFPSYYRRERPDLLGHPAVLISYRFTGFLDEIYATLVVRLHHTSSFTREKLWKYAADFKTLTDKQLGIKLTRSIDGMGELEVYFDPSIPIEEKIIFGKYIHEHLLQNARDVVRFRHYVCPHCHVTVGNREIALKKLAYGKKDIPCINCDDPAKRIPLWDEMEELFASDITRNSVLRLREQSAAVLGNESDERALVGEIISTVALAGQLCRELSKSELGFDMEVEFTSDDGQPTGRKLLLLVKSGDFHLLRRFAVPEERHVHYWSDQPFPVLLVVRESSGRIRWMDIRDYLRKQLAAGSKPITEIAFTGERFDVMSVRGLRDIALTSPP